ncbi:hypothetical protein Q7P37_002771 [Cladosporium fusiforme]
MVSFSCENCGDILTKKKLDPHRNQCRGASYTCIDCMVHFYGTEYRAHTSCMTEAQKYQGHLYRGEKKKGQQQQQQQNQPQQGDKRKSMQGQDKAMVPKPYFEDAPEEGEHAHAVAVIDVPPRAPTPPPAAQALPENVNVFDFLVQDATPKAAAPAPPRKLLERESSSMYVNHPNDSQYSQYSNGDGSTYLQRGYSYGDAPVEPTFQRYDSQGSLLPPPEAYATPAPKKEKKDKSDKSDKKRKRHHVDDLDLSAAKRPASRDDEPMTDAPVPPPSTGRVLHSGLTGGLSRLVTDPDFYADRIDAGPTPISPLKRTKRNDPTKDRDSKDDKRKSSYVSHTSSRTASGSGSTSKPSDETSSSRRSSRRHKQPSPSSSPEPRRARASSTQPSSTNQLAVQHHSRAEMFLSFVNKGPESERGVSINKALKRYHRERGLRAVEDKEDEDKELWKEVRLRKNERGRWWFSFEGEGLGWVWVEVR